MQLLTDLGYKNIDDCIIGEKLIAYDINDGHLIINELENKQWFSPDMFVDEWSVPEQVVDTEGNLVYDDDGNPVMTESVLVKTKEQIFQETYGELSFVRVNNTWDLFKNQSVWANLRVVHASGLQIGDVIYDDDDNDITITSIEEVAVDGWWRLTVSGDHSYIADNLTLHNASRYWVGGGASANWNATGNTNWGSASGLQDNASVPTSTDDVTFDGAGTGGNSNSTISATITILSLNITTGYTSTMTHNAVVTIAGNWTFGTSYTIAGTSGVTISASSTITSGGKTWSNILNFTGSNTKTLVGDLTIGGQFTTNGNSTINATTFEKLICNNGITINSASPINGTVDIYLKGGNWDTGNSATRRIDMDLFFDGDVTILNQVGFAGPSLTYLSGTITTTGSTITILGTNTLNTNGITWNNVTTNSTTITLTSNFLINGLYTNVTNTTIINTSVGATWTTSGGITVNAALSGTANIILTGGTWSGGNSINTNLFINGNITISGNVVKGSNNFTYQSGNVTTLGSTLQFNGTSTITSGSLIYNNVTFSSNNSTKTLVNDIIINGIFQTINSTQTINKTTNERIIVANGFQINGATTGNIEIIVTGGTISSTASTLSTDLTLNGNISITGTITQNGGTLRYINGKINCATATFVFSNCTILNFNKVPIRNIQINAGSTVTMNRFFTGTPSQICQISSTGTNYTITFQDDFEKMARNVAISGCTVSRPNQLLVINNSRFNTNRSTNIGIRYINQSPNGVPRNVPSINDTMTAPAMGLVNDPNFIKQG